MFLMCFRTSNYFLKHVGAAPDVVNVRYSLCRDLEDGCFSKLGKCIARLQPQEINLGEKCFGRGLYVGHNLASYENKDVSFSLSHALPHCCFIFTQSEQLGKRS